MKAKETYEVSMCVDCAIWHANGDLSDHLTDQMIEQITSPNVPLRSDVAIASENMYFSWSPCDLCGSPDGGDRVDGVVLLWD